MDKGIFCEEMAFFLDELTGFLLARNAKMHREGIGCKMWRAVSFLGYFLIAGQTGTAGTICWSELVQFSEGCGCCLADFFWFLEKVSGIQAIRCLGEQVILVSGNILDKGSAKALFGKPVGSLGFLF